MSGASGERSWHRRSWPGTGASHGVEVRLPAGRGGVDGSATVHAEVVTEDGESLALVAELGSAPAVAATRGFVARFVLLGLRLPPGYHQLRLTGNGWDATSHVISAPSQAYWPTPAPRLEWGVLLPLHAVWHRDRPGVGTFADLEAMAAAIHPRGGTVVGTLPLLAGFLDGRPEPNPYTPASRLMWNELYVDVAAPAAPTRPRQGLLVYQTLAHAQHEALARAAVPVNVSPAVEQYARFRAVAAASVGAGGAGPTTCAARRSAPGSATRVRSCSTASPSGRPTASSARWRRLSPAGASGCCSTCHSAPTPTRSTAGTTPACSATTPPSAPRRTPCSRTARTGARPSSTPTRPGERATPTARLPAPPDAPRRPAPPRPRRRAAPPVVGPGRAAPAEGVPVRPPAEELFAVVCLESQLHRRSSSARTAAPSPTPCGRP